MNKLEYYNRQKEAWTVKELQEIKTEYETNEMTISQIADIHRRTPGSISYKLKHLGIIPFTTISRGYEEYRISDLYIEIVQMSKKADIEKKEAKVKKEIKKNPVIIVLEDNSNVESDIINKPDKQTSRLERKTLRLQRNQIPSDIIELKKDVDEIKKDVRKILELMNALYEFENSQET